MNKKMKKSLLLPLAFAMLAASCGTSEVKTSSSVAVDDYDVTWVTPTGAPTLAFYDQGKNEKWLSTATPASVIPAAFAANSYDAIVFDGVSGLNLVKKNADKTKMRFSRWINELGFYVVSRTHTKEETATWNNAWTIDAFVETGNSSKAFMSLAENVWNWKGLSSTKAETGSKTVTFEAGVSDVAANISTNGFDFYVVADPVYTTLKGKMGDNLHLIYDLQEEWGKAHDGAKIPSAALFVNSATLSAHPTAMNSFLDATEARIANLVDHPEVAKEALTAYENETADAENNVEQRFGIAAGIVNSLPTLQATNKLGFKKKADIADARAYANKFQTALGAAEFDASLFL